MAVSVRRTRSSPHSGQPCSARATASTSATRLRATRPYRAPKRPAVPELPLRFGAIVARDTATVRINLLSPQVAWRRQLGSHGSVYFSTPRLVKVSRSARYGKSRRTPRAVRTRDESDTRLFTFTVPVSSRYDRQRTMNSYPTRAQTWPVDLGSGCRKANQNRSPRPVGPDPVVVRKPGLS